MDWDRLKIDRFAKLMAMAFSTQENEASAALRMAGRMLHEAGGTFDDIANVLRQPSGPFALPAMPGTESPPAVEQPPQQQPQQPQQPQHQRPSDWVQGVMIERLARAEARVNALTQENDAYKKQLDAAIRYIVELEAKIGRNGGQ